MSYLRKYTGDKILTLMYVEPIFFFLENVSGPTIFELSVLAPLWHHPVPGNMRLSDEASLVAPRATAGFDANRVCGKMVVPGHWWKAVTGGKMDFENPDVLFVLVEGHAPARWLTLVVRILHD